MVNSLWRFFLLPSLQKSQLCFSLCTFTNKGSTVESIHYLLSSFPSPRIWQLQFCGHPFQSCSHWISQFLLICYKHTWRSFPSRSFLHFLDHKQPVGKLCAAFLFYWTSTELKPTLLPLYSSNKCSENKAKQAFVMEAKMTSEWKHLLLAD